LTALYEIIPAGRESQQASVDPLRYQSKIAIENKEIEEELLTLKLRYKKPDENRSRLISQPVIDSHIALRNTSNNFRFSAAVAQFGMLLRGSEFAGSSTFDDVMGLAVGGKGEDFHKYRAEFIDLAKRCRDMGFEVAQKN